MRNASALRWQCYANVVTYKTEGQEAESQSVALSRAKRKSALGRQGAKLELLTTQTLNQEGGSARREALRVDKRERKAASDAKIIWTGGLPRHLSGLPHPPTCKQALIAQKCQIYPRSLELQKMTVNANSTQRSQLSC